MASNLKTVRVIALNAALKHLRVVNVKNAATSPVKQHIQSAGANPTFPTFMDSGAQVAGLPTIAIAGYVGPS